MHECASERRKAIIIISFLHFANTDSKYYERNKFLMRTIDSIKIFLIVYILFLINF